MFELNRDAKGRENLRRNMTEKRTAFRLRARCVSWSTNASHSAMKDREVQHLLLLPQCTECLRQNTTICLEDRTIQELRQLKQETKASGKYGASKRSTGADAAQPTSDSSIGISATVSKAQPRGGRLHTIALAAPISGDAQMELCKKRRYDSIYSAEEESSRAMLSKREQQGECWTSNSQTQDSGYSSPDTTHGWVDDEFVDDGGATFPVDGGAQTHVNAVFTAGADVSDEEFQRQIDCIMHEIPSWTESPGTTASGGPPSTQSSVLMTPEMLTLPQDLDLSSPRGSDKLPAETATPPSTMALLRQWDPMFAGMYPAQGPSSVYEHGLF